MARSLPWPVGASFEAVKKVIDLAMAGEIDATVTGPINKKSINEATAGHFPQVIWKRQHECRGSGNMLVSRWGSYMPIMHGYRGS